MERSHQTSAVDATRGAPAVHIRPLGAGDRDGLAALFARLSPDSRYRRFMSPKPRLSDGELTYLTDIDHVRHEALAAVDRGDESIVGVARYVQCSDLADAADVAIEVADDVQGRGIGRVLAQALVQRARENGVGVLRATVLWENRAARALVRRLGFRARGSQGAEIELELLLPGGSEA
jgi:protein lysine acetyltransferase